MNIMLCFSSSCGVILGLTIRSWHLMRWFSMFLNVFNVLLNCVINTITVDAIVFCQSEQHSVLKAVSWSASF